MLLSKILRLAPRLPPSSSQDRSHVNFYNGQIRSSLSQYNCDIASKQAESIIDTGRDIVHRNMALLELTTHYSALLRSTSEASFEMGHKGRAYVIELPQNLLQAFVRGRQLCPVSEKGSRDEVSHLSQHS
jgi:hypothetical protein